MPDGAQDAAPGGGDAQAPGPRDAMEPRGPVEGAPVTSGDASGGAGPPTGAPSAEPTHVDLGLVRDWSIATFVGQMASLVVPSIVAATAALGGAAVLLASVVAAGVLQGAVLGSLQAVALRRHRAPILPAAWIGWTAAGSLVGWFAGVAATQTAGEGPWGAAASVAIGAIGLLALPAAQARLLRAWSPRAWRWVPYNVVALGLAVAVVAAAATRTPAGGAWLWLATAGATIAAALGVALVTAVGLARIVAGRPMVPLHVPGPLRVLTPRIATGFQKITHFVGRFGLVIILTLLTLALPRPEGLTAQGHAGIAAFVFTAAILALQPVALPIAALMVPVALVALGVADTQQAFATFSRPVIFLLLGSMFLAEALRKHGLTRRLALHAILASRGGTSMLLLAVMGVAALVSMWVENTAAAAMLVPVALTISRQVEDRQQAQRLLVLLVLGIAYAASVGGMVTINGSSANAVASSHLAQERDWTFVDWMAFGFPAFLVLFPLTWWTLRKIQKVDVERLDLRPARNQLSEMGPLSRAEKEVLATLAGAIVLWVTGPAIEGALGLPPSLLSAALVAVMAVSYLSVREIIVWDDLKGISWGIMLVIGAGLALGDAFVRAGVSEWVTERASPLLGDAPFLMALVVLVFASALMTNVLNNTTIAAVLVPILLSLGAANPDLDVLYLVLPATLATTFGYSLPSASGRMALIAATGIVSPGTMARHGLILMLVSSAALAGLFFLLSRLGYP